MTEAVEKNKIISVSYEESPASYHNEDLGMSIAPEDALALSETAPTPDQYQSALTGLNLESLVEVDIAVRQSGAPSSLQLRSLIVEAGRGTPWAVDELENFLTRTLGLKDSSELNTCFDSCEANVADILVQLRQGDEVQRQEAAKSLLGIILGQPRDAGENIADLKRGLLVAAGQISKLTKSETFYREVAQLDERQKQSLWTMSHDSRVQPDPKLLLTLKESLSKIPETKQNTQTEAAETDRANIALAGGAAPASMEKAVAAAAATSVLTPVATKAVAWPNGGLNLIEQILAETLPRASEQQRFLQGSGGQPLSQRLAEITQNPRLTTSQIAQGLYYAILAKGMSHYDFTSAQQHYGEFRPAAAQIAGTIMTRLGLGSDAKNYLRGDYSAAKISETNSQNPIDGNFENLTAHEARGHAAQSYGIGNARSLGIFAQAEGSTAPWVTSTLATSSAVAAGMMAIPFLSLIGGTPQSQLAARSDARPSYFVEGPSTAQGENHGGTGGQSSQDQQQNRRGPNPDQVVIA